MIIQEYKSNCISKICKYIKNWIIYENSNNQEFIINENTGIVECDYDKDYIENVLGIHERKSTKLTVCDNYKEIFKVLKTYIENENKTLNDKTLENEIDILDKLI